MHCELRSADRTFYDGETTRVVAQSPRGEFAIMDGHAPLLAVLGSGPIRIHTEGGLRVYACRRGTLRVAGDQVRVLVESAVPAEEIDLIAVEAELDRLGDEAGTSPHAQDQLAMLRAVKERFG